jgi:zinc and cadmium transporter
MENIIPLFFTGLAIATVSVAGIFITKTHKKLRTYINSNLTLLTALSAGVFLVTSYNLIKESLYILDRRDAIISFAIGIIFYILLHKVLSPHRHLGDEHQHTKKGSALKMIVGDSVHNIADGLLLVASFGTSTVLGYGTALSIALHELPQEISEFFVLKKSGYTDKEALYRNFATSLTIFVGIIIGLVLLQTTILQGFLLGATGTFFLGIVLTDLFPLKSILKSNNKTQLFSALLLGVLFMASINTLVGGHSHGEPHEHGHQEKDHKEHEHSSTMKLSEIENETKTELGDNILIDNKDDHLHNH